MATTTYEAYVHNAFADTESEVASTLISICSWGLMSWSVCQRLAAAVCIDAKRMHQVVHPHVQRLAALGTSGAHSGNIRRDALSQFKPLEDLVTTIIRVPFFKTKALNAVPEYMDLPVFMPNLLFECMFQHFNRRFMEMLGSGLETFWNQVRGDDPRLLDNPCFARPGWRKRIVPLVLHGDGVRFTMKKKGSWL